MAAGDLGWGNIVKPLLAGAIALAFTCALSCQPTIAGSNSPPDTGNEWVSYCPPTEVRTRDWNVSTRQTWCWAYARGFIDSVLVMHMGFPEGVRVCVPERATAGQLTDLVTSWIMKHPADRHQPIQVLMLGALADAYPCQDKLAPTTSYR